MEVKRFVEENIENMKSDLKKLVSYNSVYSEDEAPFGSNNRKVLEEALKMMEEKGLETTNVDYYCGFGQTGEGEQLIGILAHLDVVPAGDGWSHDPFDMTEKDGYLFGRGVSDDKGAAVASMYALKYLIDEKYPFRKRVRLILGCNEESGSRCIAQYVSRYGHIDCGFTPDGGFPGIYAEKGMVSARLVAHDSKIIDVHGGDVSNAVCKRIDATLPLNSFDKEKFKEYLDERNVKYDIDEDENVTVTVYGLSAHASTPDLGVNAFNHFMEALYHSDFDDHFVSWFHKNFALDLHGELLGFEDISDDISNTSINLGVINTEGSDITVTLDMRFPVKSSSDKVLELLKISEGDCEIIINNTVEPLYFDIGSPMIRALKKAYEDVTGDSKSQMVAIGGGTYAKAINNCIAFGCEFMDEDNRIHNIDEQLKIDNFKKQVEIYVEAIRNLNEI